MAKRRPATNLRIKALRAAMAAEGLDAIVVQERKNVRYLCGFDGTYARLIVDAKQARLVTDERYAEIARGVVHGAKVVVQPLIGVETFFRDLFRESGYRTVGFEGSVAYVEYEVLQRLVRPAKSKLREAGALVRGLRRVKDDGELKLLAKAARIADQMMAAAIGSLRPGITEHDIARVIRHAAEDHGAEGESFPCIVASGPNASRPHHQPSSRKLKKGDMVTLDLGAIYGGYCSDITRTVVLGKVHPKFEEIYNACLAGQEAAVKACRAGMPGAELDAVARTIIDDAGFGKYFGHGLGHGVGLDIHESPRASKSSIDILGVNELVTIEPGIYIPGFGGVRIEDLVVVTEKGCKVLSRTPKGLTIIPC